MTCSSCETKVERSVKKLEGIINVKASYKDESLEVEYEADACNTEKIRLAVKGAGYSTETSKNLKIVGFVLIVLAVIMVTKMTQNFDMTEKLTNASYFILFIVGLLTSIHCVGMCGGIMLSQSIKKDSIIIAKDKSQLNVLEKFQTMRPALLYNSGRVISYTLLGALVGTLGSVFSLTLQMQAALQIFAAFFMIIMGLNLYGFKVFRKLNIKLPFSACSLSKKANTPFIVGFLNGLMPCGPLQTMQLYALGTGSAFKGGLSMFIFALGTVPLMLTFGALSGFLSKNSTKSLLKFGGIFIIILGFIMGGRGLALSGININPMMIFSASSSTSKNSATTAKEGSTAKLENGVQRIYMTAESKGYLPNTLYVQKGIPVEWVIDGKQITSCNNEIVVPSLKKREKLKSGETIIKFTPEEVGNINFSCWMGMIRGQIQVVDNLKTADASSSATSLTSEESAGASCCSTDGATPTSIYGDISTASTDILVKKASVLANSQSYTMRGLGYEFDPLILVVNKGLPLKLILDLKQFDSPNDEFTIISGDTGKEITKFKGKADLVNVDYTFEKAGGYGIMQNGSILSVIEAVDDVKKANIDEIRKKYLE
jgi:sulfite exporter TauE/SafE/plastocyanin domain-containing protein/copper chaperone CopZ